MLTLTDSRHILGPAAEHLSDEDILRLRDTMRELAEITLDEFHSRAENIQPPGPADPLPESE